MAIYRTGQASMDADGYITGYGTKWKTALTLIRPGATIVFASNPVAYATISEIVNDTSLRATSTGGAVVPRGDYVILLHDSITVDGLAQDVAETLRYYQGQETMYEQFVEFLKGFDWQRMEQLGEKVYADSKAAEASANAAKASETNANASKNAAAGSATTASQKATEAANSAGAARTSETNANASKNAAASSATSAANSATTAGQHKDAAAASASAARTSEGNASSSKNAAAASASAAKTSETNAKASETSATASKNAAKTSEDNAAASKNAAASSASAAAGSATSASNSAATAKSEADRAAELARQLDATNLMRKDANLSDVTNKSAARENLQVDRLVQGSTVTTVGKSGGNRLAVNDGGEWGALDSSNSWIALGVAKGGTGARDAAGAREKLEALHFRRTSLGSGDNLNSIYGFDKVGVYYNAANANATTANNYPVAFAGVLVVLSARGNGVEQTMQYYYPYIQPEMYYVRYFNKQGSSWVWSAWERYESASYLRGDTGLTATGVLGPANANDLKKNCFFSGAGNDSQNYKLPYSPGLAMRRVNTVAQMQIDGGNGTIWTRGSVDGGSWSEWKSAAMIQSAPTFTGGAVAAEGAGKRVTVGTGNSDAYITNSKSNKYLQLKDDGTLQYDSKHVMHNNLNYTGAIYDVTLKTFRITANGNNLHLRATTNDNPQVFHAGFNNGGTRLFWMGCGTSDNAVTVRSEIGSNQIKLLSDGAINLETSSGARNVYAYADNVIVRKGSRAFALNNRGTSAQDGQIYLWGNSSDRPDVIEFGFTSGYGFYVQRNSDNSRFMQVNGSIKCTTLTQTSDRDLKENIEVIKDATASLRKMNGYTYTMKEDGMPYAGVIAQEVMEALPEAVSGFNKEVELFGANIDGTPLMGEERFLGVDYSALTGLLVQVCRESDERISKLESLIEAQKAEIESLKSAVASLQASTLI